MAGVTIYALMLFAINNKHNVKFNATNNQIEFNELENNKEEITINLKDEKEEYITQEEPINKDKNTNNKNSIYIIKVDVANVREKPSTDAKIINKYKLNDEVIIIKQFDKWAELKEGGFIHLDLLSIKL